MSPHRRALGRKFAAALEEYLEHGGEKPLLAAYDLGREALAEGLGIHDVASLLHRAVWTTCPPAVGREAARRSRMTEEFILESLSPFEMAHRAAHEANDMLHRLNDLLEDEIRRLAHEVHDHSGQLLASVYLSLDDLVRDVGPEGRERLEKMRRHLDEIQEQLRLFSHELRPTILDDLGLMPALRFLCDRTSKRTGLTITVAGGLRERQPPRVETALYRIVQEALTNVAKHARASTAIVTVEVADGRLRCTVQDNGAGFEAGRATRGGSNTGLGMIGMRERVANLGGTLTLDSSPGYGTTIAAVLPLEGRATSGPRQPRRPSAIAAERALK